MPLISFDLINKHFGADVVTVHYKNIKLCHKGDNFWRDIVNTISIAQSAIWRQILVAVLILLCFTQRLKTPSACKAAVVSQIVI